MVKLKNGFTGERALVLPRMIVDKLEEDPLTSMLHITDIGYYPKAKHHFRERKEPINQYVFIYCIDGAGWYRIGEQEYTVSANQYFILPAGVPHAYASNKSSPWTIYWIHFKGILAPFYAQEASRPMDIQPESHSRISTRINLFEEIFNTLKNGYSNENLRYAFSMFHFYLGTLRYIQQFRNAATHNDSTEDENKRTGNSLYERKYGETPQPARYSRPDRVFSFSLLHAVQEENRTWPGNLLQFIKNTACLFFTRHHGYEN